MTAQTITEKAGRTTRCLIRIALLLLAQLFMSSLIQHSAICAFRDHAELIGGFHHGMTELYYFLFGHRTVIPPSGLSYCHVVQRHSHGVIYDLNIYMCGDFRVVFRPPDRNEELANPLQITNIPGFAALISLSSSRPPGTIIVVVDDVQ
jgi:hypothetical protein